MGMRRRQRRRRMVAVGAVAHHERVKHQEREAEAYDEGVNDGYAESEPPPETTYAPPPPDPAEELEHLAELHESGVLTDEEFATAKAKVLGL